MIPRQSTNKRAIEIIKKREGERLTAYLDNSTPPVWTIGCGSTRDVHEGLVITQEESDARLAEDLNESESNVAILVNVPLTNNQYSALVSFDFNFGASKLKNSTLLKILNSGDYTGAANQFGRWIHVAGKISKDLMESRSAEMELFLTSEV